MKSKEPVAKTTLNPSSSLFSPKMETLYKKLYQKHYDTDVTSYSAWLKINHPEADMSGDTLSSSSLGCCSKRGSQGSTGCKPSSSAKCEDKSAINSKIAVCITTKKSGEKEGKRTETASKKADYEREIEETVTKEKREKRRKKLSQYRNLRIQAKTMQLLKNWFIVYWQN